MAFASSGTEPAQRCREIKIVLLGDSGVGKSSIAQRYVTDTFRAHGESTIGWPKVAPACGIRWSSPVDVPDVAMDGVGRYKERFTSQAAFYRQAAAGTLPHPAHPLRWPRAGRRDRGAAAGRRGGALPMGAAPPSAARAAA